MRAHLDAPHFEVDGWTFSAWVAAGFFPPVGAFVPVRGLGGYTPGLPVVLEPERHAPCRGFDQDLFRAQILGRLTDTVRRAVTAALPAILPVPLLTPAEQPGSLWPPVPGHLASPLRRLAMPPR